jgi:hypothetical protein
MSLAYIYDLLENINNFPGRLDKESLIEEYSKNNVFTYIVQLALDPIIKFNTTRVDYIPGNTTSLDDLFKMLIYISSKNGTTNDEIDKLSRLSSFDEKSVEVIKRIVNKDLRCGASNKTFGKFITLNEYGVMLCDKDIDKFYKHINGDLHSIVWSEKLDGVTIYSISETR